MPINPELTDDTQDDSSNTNEKNQISSGQSVGVSPGSSSSSQAGGASKQGTPTSSGSFTNLNQYVNANKDQSAGLGSKIEQNVQGGANAALGQLSASGQEFNTKEQAAGVNPDDYSQEKIAATAQRALANPTDIGKSDIDKFNEARTKSAQFAAGTDTGPKALTELGSYQTAKNSLTGAAQTAGLTATESGRDTLLKQTYAKPGYTQGQTNLDQLLTQNVQSNRDKFKDLQNNLLGQYGLASQDANAVQNAANERQKVSTGTQQANTNIQNVLLGTPDKDINFPTGNNIDVSPTNVASLANTVTSSGKPVTIGTWATNGWSKDIQIVNENGKPYLYVGGQKASDGTVKDIQNLIPAYQAKTGFSLAQTTPQITTPQQGILTQYQTQLQARPGELNATQLKNYNDKIAAVTNSLRQQYGNAPLGLDINQLAQQVVASQSPTGSASLENSFNVNDMARLNALNSLAGRESNLLGDTKLGDVAASPFSTAATTSYGTAEGRLANQRNALASDVHSLATDAIPRITPEYNQQQYYTNQVISNSTQNIHDDAVANAKVANDMQGQIDAINAHRQQYGLNPVTVTSDDYAQARQQVIQNMINFNRASYGIDMPKYINDRLNSQSPYGDQFRSMIENATDMDARMNVLNNLRDNPTIGIPTSTISNKV